MKSYIDGLKRYATFDGRSTRMQYWCFYLFLLIALFIGLVIDEAAGTTAGSPNAPEQAGLAVGLIWCAHLLPLLAVTVRRLHDIDRSGHWIWIGAVPIVGQIMLLVFACTPSTPGTNRFGPPVGAKNENATQQANLGQTARIEPMAAAAGSIDQLEKLSSLRAAGAISEEEFQLMKADLLQRR
ncbi:MAG: DUF805 domain-containing protein [Rhizobium sp.]|nr:DUF805 domain-containing protein [Rhizobium sp.]